MRSTDARLKRSAVVSPVFDDTSIFAVDKSEIRAPMVSASRELAITELRSSLGSHRAYSVGDRRSAQVIFTLNSYARRELLEKVPSWDPVVTGVATPGDSKHMEDGLQLIEGIPATAIAACCDVDEHLECQITLSAR